MGLSIHYSGSIADPAKLPGLIEEVEDALAGCRSENADSGM